MEATDYKLTEKQRRDLIAAASLQSRQGAYVLHGKAYRGLEIKGLARSKVDGQRRLYELTAAGVELAQLLRTRRSVELDDPRGGPSRTGQTAGHMLRVRMDDDEWSQLETFVEREGGNLSDWTREAFRLLGALRR